jgi:hypothetical protein
MTAPAKTGHPFANVDLPRLDRDFAGLLAHAAKPGHDPAAGPAPRPGLSAREKGLFRVGLLAGHRDWGLAAEALGDLLAQGRLTKAEAERAVTEAAVVKGWAVCRHLGPALSGHGLRVPASVGEAVAGRSASSPGLTEREIFALGLGLSWGAKCWDT